MRLPAGLIGLVSLGVLLIFPVASSGDPVGTLPALQQIDPIPAHLASLSEEEISARMRFIEIRLDAGRRHAPLWNHGWTGVFGSGAVIQGVRAGLTDDSGARADYIVGSVKAVGGVARAIIHPLRAADGADALREMPEQTRLERLLRLARAERLLRADAKRARERRSWKGHVACVVVNLAGGLILWQEFDEPKRAAISAGLGIVVGELHTWSQPGAAVADLYE